MAKKHLKKAKKEKPKPRRWILPAAVIALIIVLSVILIRFYPVKIARNFEDAVSIVNGIDKAHNISFSDYEHGIAYLRLNPRYPNPFNCEEMDAVANQYRSVFGDDAARLFTGFRVNLVEAEKFYKLSGKTFKADIMQYGISCRNRNQVLESINNLNKSIEKLNSTILNLMELKKNYPEHFSFLNISDEWTTLMNASMEDFEAEINYKAAEWNRFCKNNTI